jgi:hypothetical protein
VLHDLPDIAIALIVLGAFGFRVRRGLRETIARNRIKRTE